MANINIDPAIEAFFNERKEAWLKKNTASTTSEAELKNLDSECEHLFSLPVWIPNAAKRAGQMSISTHPCTFSHPSARKNKNGYVSSVIANSKCNVDGFLRSGNVKTEPDALGNAAALDVYKFLSLVMQDGKTLLSHINNDTNLAKKLLADTQFEDGQNYESIKSGFMAMSAGTKNDSITSSKIKQVYFPVHDSYHLLSLLTPSGIVFELRKRLDNIRFGEHAKTQRELRKNEKKGDHYIEIYNLTTIGYGGTKPQNISVLNNQNGGKAHLLMSAPPTLYNRTIQFPTQDFFTQSIRFIFVKYQFNKIHKLYKSDLNNLKVRNTLNYYYQDIVDLILEKSWQLRNISETQYFPATSSLDHYQRIWLVTANKNERNKADDWLDELVNKITQFIIHGYEKVIGKNEAIRLGDAEFKHINNTVAENRELLR